MGCIHFNSRMEKKIQNAKIVDGAVYGYAVLKDNSKQPLAVISKDTLDISKFDNKKITSQWFRYMDNIFLGIYWPLKKSGLVFPFSKNDHKIIKNIIKKEAFAVANNSDKGKMEILIADVKKKEPLEWIKKMVDTSTKV